jgi:cell division protease FtsH
VRKFIRPVVASAAVAIIVLVAISMFVGGGSKPKKYRLDQFLTKVDHGQVAEATLKDGDRSVSGKLHDGTKFKTSYPERYTSQIVDRLQQHDVEIKVDHQHTPLWESLLFNLGPFVLILGAFFYFVSAMQGGGSKVISFGKARAKQVSKDEPKVTFADVAGVEEAVEELQEIKDFLQHPAKFQAMGAKIPKGVLLYGPPGTGKTLLARAVAGEAGVPFFSISGSDFVEMFVGVGASRVRDLFEQAKAAAPAIVFVDEIDAVGRHRGAGLGGGHDEREQTLNQLLVEMDGFDVKTGVILIAATNRPDILDPALLRPGRFDRQIVVDQPDLEGRRAILNVHAKGKPLAPDVHVDVVARRTPGFTGADLANLMNEAALLAARRDKSLVSMEEMEDAIDRVIAGPERKTKVLSERERRVIAYHEGGHALVGHVLPGTDPIHKISIVARGRALGWTLALPTEDKVLRTRSELRDQLAMILGGRTAEEMIFGDPTTGASDDIERATNLARAMVTEWGMSDHLGPQRLGDKNGEVFLGRDMGHQPNYSDSVAADIDAEIRRLIDEGHAEAREILELHRPTLDRLADALVEHETLDPPAIMELFGGLDTWKGKPTPNRRIRKATAGGGTGAKSAAGSTGAGKGDTGTNGSSGRATGKSSGRGRRRSTATDDS